MSVQPDGTQSQQPCWDDMLRRKSDASGQYRRDSISSRRNSLFLSDTLFDFPLTPGMNRDHNNIFTYNDPDPFAPLSYGESLPLVPSIVQSRSAMIDRLLGERSESSIVSVPTIVSMGSYSMTRAQQQNQMHYSSSSDQSAAVSIPYPHGGNNHHSREQSYLAIDRYQRNQAVTPMESLSSTMITKTKSIPRSSTHRSSSTTLLSNNISAHSKSTTKTSRPKQMKAEYDVDHDDDDHVGNDIDEDNNHNDDDDDDDEDDESGTNRFKPFHEEKWTSRYKELLAFHQLHGHAAVPHTYPANPQLARWVKRQRRQYKLRKDKRPSTMTTERLDLLSTVGFVWDSHDVNWREKLDGLEAYRQEFGNCNVPSNYRDKKLATWVKCQRRQYKLYWDNKPSAMGPDRIMELEKVGFEWEIRSTVPRSNSSTVNTATAAATPTPTASDAVAMMMMMYQSEQVQHEPHRRYESHPVDTNGSMKTI
jgi:Helicase associated domain